MATCQVKKGLLLFLSEGPYASDRNYHLVRMALSIALDAKPQLVFVGDAVRLSLCTESLPPPLNAVAGHLRMLQEMGVPMYALEEDLVAHEIIKEAIIPGIKPLPKEQIAVLMDRAGYVCVT